MGRKMTKRTAIRPVPEPIPTPAVISASPSSDAATSSSPDAIPTAAEDAIPTQQTDSKPDSDANSPPKPVNPKPVDSNPTESDSEFESESESEPSPAKAEAAAPTKRAAETESPSVKRAKKDNSEPVNPAASDSESESESECEPSPDKPEAAAPTKRAAESESSLVKRAKKDNSEPVNPAASDSESESESESEPSPAKPEAAAPTKRAAEIESSSVKRAKKDNSEPVNPAAPSKKLFERVWSSEDELVILKGLYDYKAEKEIDPVANSDDFVAFIKKNLQADASKSQIMGKIRRLKKRLDTLQKRKKIGDPHDIKVFELSKRIWSVDGDEPIVAEVKTEKKKKTGLNAKRMSEAKVENVDVDVDGEVEFVFGDGSGTVLREAMKRVEGEEKAEMRMMVEKANAVYLDAYLLRLKVLDLAAKKILDGIPNHQT